MQTYLIRGKAGAVLWSSEDKKIAVAEAIAMRKTGIDCQLIQQTIIECEIPLKGDVPPPMPTN